MSNYTELTVKIAVLEDVLDRMNRLEMPEQPLCDRSEIYRDIVAGMLLDCQTELIESPITNFWHINRFPGPPKEKA
jgi:hypothetical protein